METQAQNLPRQLMAEVNALQNRMKADIAAKKTELDQLVQEINQLQISAIKNRDTSQAKVVKAKTRQLFEAQVAHLASRQHTTKQQLSRLNKAREFSGDTKQRQQLDDYITRKKREYQDLAKEIEQIHKKAEQKAIVLEGLKEGGAKVQETPFMARTKAEAKQLIDEVKSHHPLADHLSATTDKAEEAKRLIEQIRVLQEAAENGTLTENELQQLEERVSHIEAKQRANRDEINQLTQAKIKYELALAKARKDRLALQERKQHDEKLKEELSTLIEEKESEQRQLMDELEAMRQQAEQEATALKAQRDAARALAEKQAEDSEMISAEKSYHGLIMAGSVVTVVLVVLAIYFLTPLSSIISKRIDEIMNPPPPDQQPIPQPEPEATVEPKPKPKPVEARPLGFFRDRLKSGGPGPAMAKLPGGTFLMGSSNAPTEMPRIEVTLKSFSISQYEITFEDYERFARATSRKLPRSEDRQPVNNVSWHDAVDYTDWLTRESGQLYRLPSEREWEYAARAGSDGTYWWGDSFEDNRANCKGCGSRWDNRTTAPVGSFTPNDFSLHDMVGNVMEWTISCYHPNYEDAPNQVQIWEGGDCSKRMVRGSAYDTPVAHLRMTMRLKHSPNIRAANLGFRVVRVD